jgi:hypothetical protein
MRAKAPIDLKRDSAISGTVGTADEGAIEDFFNVGDSLLMIKKSAIYKFQLADQIDPGRTNIAVPHTQQKLYSVGSSSEVVGRTLITAKYLFERGMLDNRFEKSQLLSAALKFFDEVIAAVTMFENLTVEHNSAIAAFEKQKTEGSTILIPSVPDAAGRVKAFIQRAEHSIQQLLALCQIFYSMPAGKAWFDSFVEAAEAAHSLQQEELERIKSMAKYAQFVRNCRHCIEHPKPRQKIIVQDFKMSATAQIDSPTIEVVHRDTPEPKIPLLDFMHQMLSSILLVGEQLMAFLASRHVMTGWEDKVGVVDFPEGQRRHPHVRYYFAMNMGGTLVPMG